MTETALEYMFHLHPTLANEYRTPDGKNSESCGLIALELAERLLQEERQPYIAQVRGKLRDSINREGIFPKPFAGRKEWSNHQVCCCDGLAYDPMRGPKPTALDSYCQQAFLGEVEMSILIPHTKIKEFIER